MTKTTVTSEEVDETQKMAHMALALVDGREAHVALGALIMAATLYGQFVRIPLENLCAIFDNTAVDTYRVLGKDNS